VLQVLERILGFFLHSASPRDQIASKRRHKQRSFEMRKVTASLGIVLTLALLALAQGPHQFRPGFNLFSKEQDVQLGKEAASQVEKQSKIVTDAVVSNYVQRIGERLAATPDAGGYPYTFKVVADNSINAFALPGGPTFVNTGLILAADNEAQIAGVLAHEISHVALRHGTNQASKANLIRLPAMLASSVAGNGSMLGQLSQLGIGLGANSVLLKFSRTAERDADLLGSHIMAEAGYDPMEMARFFQKLEAEGGARGPQFLSDHPNPGNRVTAVRNEVSYLPQRSYSKGNNAELARVQSVVKQIKVPPPPPPQQQQQPR
jgi:predicted Zn-dependent protease